MLPTVKTAGKIHDRNGPTDNADRGGPVASAPVDFEAFNATSCADAPRLRPDFWEVLGVGGRDDADFLGVPWASESSSVASV